MNKNLSLAIEKAVRNFPSKQEIKDLDKRPDLIFTNSMKLSYFKMIKA